MGLASPATVPGPRLPTSTGRALPALWLLAGLGISFGVRSAMASCGAENCSLDNPSLGLHRFTFEVSYQYIDQDQARVGTQDSEIGAIPSHADEIRTFSQTTLFKGQMVIVPGLQATVTLPYIAREHSHLSHALSEEPALREWQYSGIGDMSAMVSWRAWGGGDETAPLALVLHGGAKLPTGERHVDPIDGEEPEPHARLGTGSTDALFGAALIHHRPVGAGPGTMSLFVSTTGVITGEGTDGYRVGSLLDASIGGSYPLGARLQLLAQLNLRARAKDESAGEEGTGEARVEEENTGGTAAYASPGLRFRVAPFVSVSGYAQLPVYQNVNGIQLVAPYHLWFGATFHRP